MKDWKVGDRVRWSVWGMTYTGVIVKVVGEDSLINKAGDLRVRMDDEFAHGPGGYPGQVVTILPDRTATKIG